MSTLTSSPTTPPLALQLEPTVELTDDQFFELCQRNKDLRLERTSTGKLILMPPAGGRTSDRNALIAGQLWSWARRDRTGRSFDSSGGFTLPNGAMRSPDAAWVELARLKELPQQHRERFLPLCPTFVLELRSPSDPLASVEAKMQEYVDSGARLGWLVDPIQRRVHVYRPGTGVEILERPRSVVGDPELPGFVLELEEIWAPVW